MRQVPQVLLHSLPARPACRGLVCLPCPANQPPTTAPSAALLGGVLHVGTLPARAAQPAAPHHGGLHAGAGRRVCTGSRVAAPGVRAARSAAGHMAHALCCLALRPGRLVRLGQDCRTGQLCGCSRGGVMLTRSVLRVSWLGAAPEAGCRAAQQLCLLGPPHDSSPHHVAFDAPAPMRSFAHHCSLRLQNPTRCAHRAALPCLEELRLAGASLAPPHGERLLRLLLAGSAASLRQLDLRGVEMRDGLAALEGGTQLSWLDLSGAAAVAGGKGRGGEVQGAAPVVARWRGTLQGSAWCGRACLPPMSLPRCAACRHAGGGPRPLPPGAAAAELAVAGWHGCGGRWAGAAAGCHLPVLPRPAVRRGRRAVGGRQGQRVGGGWTV